VDPNLTGGEISGKQVLPMNKLTSICRNMNIHIGIITVPASQAQGVCDALVESGVMAIWNFAPVHLNTPEGILYKTKHGGFPRAALQASLRAAWLKEIISRSLFICALRGAFFYAALMCHSNTLCFFHRCLKYFQRRGNRKINDRNFMIRIDTRFIRCYIID
jgi:hypothetical protein